MGVHFKFRYNRKIVNSMQTVKVDKVVGEMAFCVLYVVPYFLQFSLGKAFGQTYLSVGLFVLSVLILILIAINSSKEFIKQFYPIATIALLFSFLSTAATFINFGNGSLKEITFPFVTLTAIVYVYRFDVTYRFPLYFLIYLLIHYYQTYFSKEITFSLNAYFYQSASSNAIPILLNNLILTVLVLRYRHYKTSNFALFLCSIVGVYYSVIQGSRAGLAVAVCISLIIIITYSNKLRTNLLLTCIISIGVILMILTIIPSDELLLIFHGFNAGNGEIYISTDDDRIVTQLSFYKQLDARSLMFGFEEANFNGYSYTYNAFLDFWINHTFIGGVLLFFIFGYGALYNLVRHHRLFLCLLPAFFYCLIESIYFPGYYDLWVFLILYSCFEFQSFYSMNST